MKYDVIVIGGGPSGLMASVSAGMHGAKVLLVDKGEKLGRKLAISGGGRCNVTNNKELDEMIQNIPGNGRFLYSSFSVFDNRDIIHFFEGLGIKLKEEDRGRMFPVSNKAKDVVDALLRKVKEAGTEIRVNAPVQRIRYEEGQVKGVRLRNGEEIEASNVIVAVGGKSVPHTGSTGDGYAWAEEAGHTITELYPTEVPITLDEDFIQQRTLQGLSLRDIRLSVYNATGRKVIEHEGDMIFTHFGISGPAALRCSQFVVKTLKQTNGGDVRMTIDLFPDKSQAEIFSETYERVRNEPKKTIKNVLKGYVPERLIPLVLERAGLREDITFANLPKGPWEKMAQLLKEFPLHANGTLSIEEAFVTGGGVNLKEIDPKTMQSKLMQGLFFCGEILDIHGYTGGYNITAAFSTGYTAGKSAAERMADVRIK
ncbi:NAD(P)/FAD-dependent oxidoreductase [Effusibacillus consociatus]|uniref:NAD(P)/FAD-dependent oxidoreductase n=1 Tax=Effusibacillus consociatus TaxID=1117041 RepID=A0ABV9Q8N4_9BACL